MITAKEINNRRFEQAKPGYAPNEVDDFLREIAHEITACQREKEELEKKMEVLVESVREYKRDEEALKDALIGAQKQGRAIIAEAQVKADRIAADATAKAGDIIGNTRIQLEKEKRNLTRIQQEVTEFKANLLAMYKNHLAQITSIPDFEEDEEEELMENNTAPELSSTSADTGVSGETAGNSPVMSEPQERYDRAFPDRNNFTAERTFSSISEPEQADEIKNNSERVSPERSAKVNFDLARAFDSAGSAPADTGRSRFGELKFGDKG